MSQYYSLGCKMVPLLFLRFFFANVDQFLGRLRSVDLITWVRCPSVRTSVLPQKVFLIPMKFGMQIEVSEWCTTVCCMTRSNVKVTRPLKLEILQFSKSISSAIFNMSWQMTTDSETTAQYLTFVWSRFLISVLIFVSRDFELGRVSVYFAKCFCNCNNIRHVAAAFGGDRSHVRDWF